MSETIHVTATNAQSRQVVLWEQSPKHPGGECWIVADGRTFEVGRTPRVEQLLASGVLAQVEPAGGAHASRAAAGGSPDKPRGRKRKSDEGGAEGDEGDAQGDGIDESSRGDGERDDAR